MLSVHSIRLVLMLISLLLINACATRPVPEFSVNAQRHQSQLLALKDWQIRGKLAFRSNQDKFSASMNWQQHQQDFRLNLSSFIGTRLLLLEKRQGQVALHYDDKIYHHTNAGDLLYELLGWTLPLEPISQWVKGKTSPGTLTEFSDNGLVNRIQTTDGWVVRLDDYRQEAHLLLPHQISLRAGPNQIKIRVDAWQLN